MPRSLRSFHLLERLLRAHPIRPHPCAGVDVQSEHSPRILPSKQMSAIPSPVPVRAPPQHMLHMMPRAKLRSPSFRWRVLRQSSFAAFPRPNSVSSFASDLPVNPRKLFATACDQATDVCLFQRQTGSDLAVGESLLFQQQATSHRLFYFV